MDTVKNNLGFEVVPRKETTRILLAFQDSFRGFLDGSEFMATNCPPAQDSFDFLSSVVEAKDEAQKMEAAMCNARKMARECSLQTIGSYQPYDVADPNTWNRKQKKKKRRESAGLLSAPVSNRPTQEKEFHTASSEMVAASTGQKNRRASAPTSSLYACDQEPKADSTKEDGRKIKDGRRSGRKSLHRSYSPSRNASGKREKRSRRVPKATTISDNEVHDAPQDCQSEGNDVAINLDCASLTNEDTINLRFDDLHLTHEDRSPETRKRSELEVYRSDQSISVCSKTSKENECHSSQPSSAESSAMLQLELKEKMLQERLVETARRLSALKKKKRFLHHDSNTAPTSMTDLCRRMTSSKPADVNLKAERRRQSYSTQSPVAASSADASNGRTSLWGVRRQSCDV